MTTPASHTLHAALHAAAHPAHPLRRAKPAASIAACAALLCSLAGLVPAGSARAQQIDIDPPGPLLQGDPVRIGVSGLPPAAEITVRTRRGSREWDGVVRPYEAQATYRSDAQGRIDLATMAPLRGSYDGADLRGLFWSMGPVRRADAAAAPPLPPDETVEITAHRGDDTAVLARATIVLRRSLPDVQTRPAEGFPGALYAHRSAPGAPPSRRPALILLGGSEGGSLITRDAAMWASRGYAVLALPYYSPPGFGPNGPTPPELPALPPAFADIPLERLESARDWLVRQPEVDASRIGVMGTSKGAEFALAAAVRMPWIAAVVAIVPSDVIWEGWGPGVESGRRPSFAWRGEPLPFVPYQGFEQEFAGFATGQPVIIRRPQDRGRAANPGRVPAARIPVERIAAPVLVIGAHDDQVWDSGGMAEAIATARRAAGKPVTTLVFREAGHALGGTGWTPTTQYNASPMKMGGSPATTARAQAEAYAGTVAFLREALGARP